MAVKYEKGSTKNDTFVVENEQHLEINNKSGGKDTISFNEDLTNLIIDKDGLNLVIKKNDDSKSATILNYFSKDGKTTSSSVKYLKVGTTPENTQIIDLLNSGIINSEITEFTRDKKGKISGSVFSDTITGTDLADNIVASGGNDEITGGEGADTITGGAGKNIIKYTKGDGNDVINLTKGENFTLSLLDIDNINKIKFEFVKNDLRIYTDATKTTSEDEYITIKNFVAKDVTNNGNAKKGIEDTSSVELKIGSETYDLRNLVDKYGNHIYGKEVKSNYTGSWLNESIWIDEDYKPTKGNKGVTLDGKGGNDVFEGSNYNDVIKGGDGDDTIDGYSGNDTITGGTGKNTISIYEGEGNDIINLTKGENLTIIFKNVADINNVKFEFVKNDLRIYTDATKTTNDDEYITIKNFVAKDLTNNGNAKKGIEDTSSVELKIGSETYNLRNLVDSENFPCYYEIDTSKNYSGSWLGEYIDGQYYRRYTDKAQTMVDTTYTKKGITLDGKGGNDGIDGSMYSDVIKGGDGDDTLYGERGNDTITAGTGKNTINVCEGEGNDVINLTKGENFTLNLLDIDNINKLKFEFVKNDLRIYTDATKTTNEDEYITIKNFVSKDVTNNGNAKKGIDDTSSVELKIGGKTYDLRNAIYDINGDSEKDYFYQIKTEKNYTGSWLNEQINAEEYKRYTDKKKTIVDTDVTKKGLSLNGKDGNDLIGGSNYSDTIKGGSGDDVITGGTGSDKLYGEAGSNLIKFYANDGLDTVYSGKGEDTVVFENEKAVNITFEQVKKDLIIHYGNDDAVTLKDYFTLDKKGNITGIESSVQNITIEECKFNFITGKETITGTEESNIIWGSEKEHVITGGKGNDIIFGGEVKNTYIFNLGDGTDIINYKGGNDVIKFTDVEITDITFSDYDLENQTFTMSYGESDKITVKGLSTDRNSVKIEDSTGTQYTIFVGDGDNISSTVQKPNSKENTLFISSTAKDSFEGNTGINVFTNCNKYDSNIGAAQGTNIFFITSEQSANLYAQGKNDKIIFKDLKLSDLVYTFPTNSVGKVVITDKNNLQRIELMNFATSNVNPTIVDKNGDTTTVCDELDIILDDVGTSGDDIILSSKRDTEVYGKGGSDYINVNADNITIYTYDKDLKNTTEGSSVIVKTNNNYKYTIYAQSEENIIYNEAYNAHGTYYAYIDQKTSIKETNNQTKSTDSVLNIMNTNDEYDKDGVHSDLSIIFNVDKGYTAASGVGNVGDVYIVDATNLSAWANGNDFKGITIKNNVVETINSADGYSITSTQIAQLAEKVATWLTSDGRDYASVNAVLSSGNETDINALTTYFAQDNNWTAPTP